MSINNLDPKKYVIKQVASRVGEVTNLQPLWPQTIGEQVLDQTSRRLLDTNSFRLGGTYLYDVDTKVNTFTDGTSSSTWSALIQQNLAGQTGNITLTLPSKTGTIALTSDFPPISFTDGFLDGSYNQETGAISLSPYSSKQGGSLQHFYLGTTNPTVTTRLNLDGVLYATQVHSIGNSTIGGTLGVTSDAMISGALAANGGISVSTDKFTVASGTGNTNIAGTLIVGETATLNGIVDINNIVTIDGASFNTNVTGNSSISINGNSASALDLTLSAANSGSGSADVLISAEDEIDLTAQNIDINGAVDISSTLNVTGISTLTGLLNANGGIAVDTNKFTVSNTGNVLVAGTLGVTGDTTLTGDLAVNGGDLTTNQTTFNIIDTTASTVNAFGAATVLNLGHDGTSTSTVNLATGVIGSGNTKTLNLGTSADAGGTTVVNIGASGAGAANSSVNIYGNLNVSGVVNTVNTQEINISDNVIVLNSDLDDTIGSGWTAGIKVKTGASTEKTLLWDQGDDRWELDGQEIASAASKLSLFSATSSAELAGVISDETGYATGAKLVFSTNPTLEGLTSSSIANLNGGLAVDADKFTVDTSGNVFAAGTLEVDGKTTINSSTTKALGVVGNRLFEVLDSENEELFSVRENGDVVIGSTLTLTGTENEMTGNFSVQGDVDISGSLLVAGDATFKAEIFGNNMTLAGDLYAKGDIRLGNQNTAGIDHVQIDGYTSITQDVVLLPARKYFDTVADQLKIYKKELSGANAWVNSNLLVLTTLPTTFQDLADLEVSEDLKAGTLTNKQSQFVYENTGTYTLYTLTYGLGDPTTVGGTPLALIDNIITVTESITTTRPDVKITLDSDSGNAAFAGDVNIVGALTAGSIGITSINGLAIDATSGSTLDFANNTTLDVDGDTTLGVNSITLESGNVLDMQYAGLTLGASGATGDITIKSDGSSNRSLTLNADTVIGSLTSGHVLYASATGTISSEAQLAVSRGGTGVSTTSANVVFAGPNGSSGAPSFRSLVNADLPNSTVSAGTYQSVTVDAKGIVTAGRQLIQVGYYTTSADEATNQPALNLGVGGLFFEALEATV
jgi:hypothetical protein